MKINKYKNFSGCLDANKLEFWSLLYRYACLYFTASGPLLSSLPWSWPLVLASSLYLLALAPYLYLPALVPNLYLLTLVYNFITSSGLEFWIYRPSLLNMRLYLRPWSTICITGLGLEFAFALLLVVVVVAVIVVIVVLVAFFLE